MDPVPAGGIPAFDLYGEPQARARIDPVHVEPLFSRSALHDWNIRPHRHRDLCQLFWLRHGGGVMLGEGAERPVQAPMLLVIPPGQVHGFRFEPDSAGHVLTLTGGFLATCRALAEDTGFAERLACLRPEPRGGLAEALEQAFQQLDRAYRGVGADRHAALAGQVLLLLALLRQAAEARAADQAGAARALLVRRFREAVEQHYTEHQHLERYCARLGVTRSTLTRACRAVTGRAPLALVHERLGAEARRLLIHGSRSVSEVAYALGFEPAYFSRFFTRMEGVSPAAFRQRGLRGEDAGRSGE